MNYAIWDKKSNVYTPAGGVYTPEEWMDKHPAAKDPNMVILCAAGPTNGAVFATLDMVVSQYEEQGADFTGCETPEEKLAVIAAFNEEKKQQEEEESAKVSASERIAAALEYSNLLNSPVINDDDPDLDDEE